MTHQSQTTSWKQRRSQLESTQATRWRRRRMRTKLVRGRGPVSKQTDNMARQSSRRTLRGRFHSNVRAKEIIRDARRYLYCDTNRDGAVRGGMSETRARHNHYQRAKAATSTAQQQPPPTHNTPITQQHNTPRTSTRGARRDTHPFHPHPPVQPIRRCLPPQCWLQSTRAQGG